MSFDLSDVHGRSMAAGIFFQEFNQEVALLILDVYSPMRASGKVDAEAARRFDL